VTASSRKVLGIIVISDMLDSDRFVEHLSGFGDSWSRDTDLSEQDVGGGSVTDINYPGH
jgi:hypothetical protein